MTKKQNTILFITLGTIFNIIITLIFIFLFAMLAAVLFPNYLAFILPVIFVLSIVLAIIVYQKLVAYITKKFNLEEKMDPIFKSKKR